MEGRGGIDVGKDNRGIQGKEQREGGSETIGVEGVKTRGIQRRETREGEGRRAIGSEEE